MDVFLSVGQGLPLSLSEQSQAHVEQCPVCATELERLIEAERQRREMGSVWALVNRYQAGDRGIIIREFAAGVALFDPDRDGQMGVFAYLRDGCDLIASDRISRDTFDKWDPSILSK